LRVATPADNRNSVDSPPPTTRPASPLTCCELLRGRLCQRASRIPLPDSANQSPRHDWPPGRSIRVRCRPSASIHGVAGEPEPATQSRRCGDWRALRGDQCLSETLEDFRQQLVWKCRTGQAGWRSQAMKYGEVLPLLCSASVGIDRRNRVACSIARR
jgi:hypothetical protein